MNPANLWTPGEASAVNEFLNSPVGRKWLGVLYSRKPRMDIVSMERAAITGAFANGYEHVFAVIGETRTSSVPQDASISSIDATKD